MIARPATAGPMSLALLNAAELRATAFAALSLPTRSETKVCRAGLSNAVPTPKQNASTNMSGSVITPLSSRMPIVSAIDASVAWVTRSRFRLGKRSATQPVMPTRSSGGPNCSARQMPIAAASSWVSTVSTVQLSAVDCAQEPTFETSEPKNQRR